MEKEIFWANHVWILHPLKYVFWPLESALILSDLHVGKSAHFRKNGIPIPSCTQTKDFQNLHNAFLHYQPKKLIIVGDLIHAGHNTDVDEFKSLLSNHPQMEVILVKGNHDRLSHSKLSELGIHSIYDQYTLNGIVFTHEMIPDLDQYQISGHFHVGVEIQLPTKNKIRLPAFYISEKNLLLPAFCSFTGLDTRNHINSKNIYAIYKNEILAL